MVEYRRFRNSDPPALRRLWHECGLGRGAALDFDADSFETVVFSQPYFDPNGLMIAEDQGEVIGYVHAGFGVNSSQDWLSPDLGAIGMVMVLPKYRRQGIGRELVRRAEEYLQAAGTRTLQAGFAAPCDPYYYGLYGGSQPAGFLISDADADPFFQALGYVPLKRSLVFQRSIGAGGDPVGLRIMGIRRTTKLAAPDVLPPHSWWWHTRPGRLDTLELGLAPKSGGQMLATVSIVGLDFYVPRWRERAIGLFDLEVPETQRKKGYAQALLVEVCRRVRNEMITLVEAHTPDDDLPAVKAFESAKFEQVDVGVVYGKP